MQRLCIAQQHQFYIKKLILIIKQTQQTQQIRKKYFEGNTYERFHVCQYIIKIIMIQNKIIEEADEALQNSFNSPLKKHRMQANIKFEINSVCKEVDKIISNLHGTNEQQNNQMHKQKKAEISIGKCEKDTIQKKQEENISLYQKSVISKYNYTGQKYRFQQRQEMLNISKPQIPNLSNSEVKQKRYTYQKQATKTENLKSQTVLANQNLSLHQQDVKYPSQNYFIMFNEKQKAASNLLEKNKSFTRTNGVFRGKSCAINEDMDIFNPQFLKNNSKAITYNKSNNLDKSKYLNNTMQDHIEEKPRWVLERKIANLEKQVKRLSQKQAYRESLKKRQQIDNRIKLGSRVQAILNDLFP